MHFQIGVQLFLFFLAYLADAVTSFWGEEKKWGKIGKRLNCYLLRRAKTRQDVPEEIYLLKSKSYSICS